LPANGWKKTSTTTYWPKSSTTTHSDCAPINLAQLPRDIARLPPGVHRTVRRDGRSLRVLVRDSEFGRLYITYDVSDHERSQRIALLILILGVGGILALTTWAAWRISQPLLAPVDRLAKRLSQIDPRQRHVRFAADFAGNELEAIASSIDSYLERLDGFVEREQAFTSTASHELRTPLAVVQGAVELLAEQHAGHAGSANALARIQRAVREMSEFTAALLSLAREPDSAASHGMCDMAALLPRIVDDQRAASPGKQVDLLLPHNSALQVNAPDSMAVMVVGNVIRNALQHGSGDRIGVSLQDRTLTVTNQGRIGDADLPRLFEPRFTTRSGGHGMGLYLARRICERYGWSLTISNDNGQTKAALIV
jgi:signal transduction histidine kinase